LLIRDDIAGLKYELFCSSKVFCLGSKGTGTFGLLETMGSMQDSLTEKLGLSWQWPRDNEDKFSDVLFRILSRSVVIISWSCYWAIWLNNSGFEGTDEDICCWTGCCGFTTEPKPLRLVFFGLLANRDGKAGLMGAFLFESIVLSMSLELVMSPLTSMLDAALLISSSDIVIDSTI